MLKIDHYQKILKDPRLVVDMMLCIKKEDEQNLSTLCVCEREREGERKMKTEPKRVKENLPKRETKFGYEQEENMMIPHNIVFVLH